VGKRVGRGSRVRGREGGEVAECAVERGGGCRVCDGDVIECVSESDEKYQNVRQRVW
jgi:hypothetical protein